MCGLVGFIDNRSKAEKKKIIKSMSDKIIHRGPDGEGFFVDNSIAMGFRRLSIIDLEGGNQPLYSEDENLVINFNGEVYNYKELREDLIEKGHIFKTEADTEVVLHGYEEYGTDILKKLRGMYGFAIWNRKEQELFLVRVLSRCIIIGMRIFLCMDQRLRVFFLILVLRRCLIGRL